MKAWIRRQFRRRPRVFIFPTRMGGYLNGLIFLMFLLAIGYANNLLLIFTLFLLSFNMIWLIQTHFYLAALKFDQMIIDNGHASAGLPVNIQWKKSPQLPYQWEVKIESDQGDSELHTLDESQRGILGEVVLENRGVRHWKHLRVATELPFGLYRSWIYWPLNVTTYVYPELLKESPELHFDQTHLEGQIPKERKGHEDIRDLSPYRGEESRKISWKHYARSGELFVKEGTEWNDHHLHLKLNLPKDHILKEQYLKKIATTMVSCFRNQIPFTFETETMKRGPSSQEKHLADCLKDLSLC